MTVELLLYIGAMAVTTYLIRMLPFTLFRKKIKNPFLKSFFYYIPYAVLAAMTFPAIFYSTGSVFSASMGLLIAIVLAFLGKPLIVVAIAACVAAFAAGFLPF